MGAFLVAALLAALLFTDDAVLDAALLVADDAALDAALLVALYEAGERRRP